MEDLPIKRLERVHVKMQLRLFTSVIGQGCQALTPVLTNLLFHLLLSPLKVLLDGPGKASLSVVVYHQGQACLKLSSFQDRKHNFQISPSCTPCPGFCNFSVVKLRE